jgi:hypothetical protein
MEHSSASQFTGTEISPKLTSRVLRGKDSLILQSIFTFYALRALTQVIFKFRYPNEYIWPRTKIPSLLVPYGHQCDFYFSGHSGFMVLMICEFQRIKQQIRAQIFSPSSLPDVSLTSKEKP